MPTVKVGTIFNSAHADSISEWKVVNSRGGKSWDCEIISEDWSGHRKVFGTEEILGAIHRTAMYKEIGSESDNWWSKRVLGETVHYHDSFGRFVRGVIIEHDGEKQMQPTALVGAWKPHDLPMRARDGSVRYSYSVMKILFPDEKSPMRPHSSNMYESSSFGRKDQFPDPRNEPACDLSDPPALEGEDAKLARFEKARMDISKLVGEGYANPEQTLIEARKLIDEALA